MFKIMLGANEHKVGGHGAQHKIDIENIKHSLTNTLTHIFLKNYVFHSLLCLKADVFVNQNWL